MLKLVMKLIHRYATHFYTQCQLPRSSQSTISGLLKECLHHFFSFLFLFLIIFFQPLNPAGPVHSKTTDGDFMGTRKIFVLFPPTPKLDR